MHCRLSTTNRSSSALSQRMSGLSADNLVILRDQQLSKYLWVSGLAIIFYDYFLTLDSEKAYVWIIKPKFKRSSAWFLFIRYFTLSTNIAMAFIYFGDFSSETCKKLQTAPGLLIVVQQLFVGVTLILRVYAMYGLDRRVLTCLVIAALTTIAVAVWSAVPAGQNAVQAVEKTFLGCIRTPSLGTRPSESIRLAAAWEAELGCNAIVLSLTMYRAFQKTRNTITPPGSLWHVMMRDGALYFGIICLANLANILLLNFGDPNISSSLAWPTSTISIVMITRLMLSLHAAASLDSAGEPTHTTQPGTIQFAHSTRSGQDTSAF